MNILNIEHIHKIFGDKVIFDDISCGIDQGEKIGIIGVNGTGKTTLLRVIAGEEEPDEGQVITQNGIRISWLPQTPEFPQHMTILDYVAEGKWQKDWSTESEARRMLNTLGITDQNINMDNLSGGEKKRVALARMLLNPADILILDEPTNHLDGEMVIWLEDFLRNFRGTVIMVTHDRYFLDRVANRILEISHGKLYSYAGDYSRFLELKAQREEMELASDRKRRSVLRMELEWAARGCRARSTKQRARLDRLEALKAGKTPLKEQNVEMDSIETRMGKKTIEFHHVSKTIEGRLLINDFDHIVLRDQRLGIIGPNGCGKSTLLKMADGLILPDSGEIQIGETIRIGYLAQNVPDMDGRQRVIDYIREVAEYVPTKEGRITASQMLERFLFDPAMQYTPVEKLSGGEKRRLYLLKVLMEAPNVLLLDEPLGALDLKLRKDMQTELKAIQKRLGITFIYVTHDQEEALSMSDTIVVMDKGKIQQIGTPEDIYNEPVNAFVADFIGESNIVDAIMIKDYLVSFGGVTFECLDSGFGENAFVEAVVRPEDIKIVKKGSKASLPGKITSVTFKGVHFEILVDVSGFIWMIQTIEHHEVGEEIGMYIEPDAIHIMNRSEYSGEFGDYSYFSDEMDHISDASYNWEEENEDAS